MTANRLEYRIYDKINNCYTDIAYILTQGGLIRHINFEEGNIELLQNQDDYVVEFSTGLVDKNGKEIFEGDILKMYTAYNDEDEIDTNEFYITDVGKYGKVNVFYKDYDYTLLDWLDDEEVYEYEIIGNIYQNPELMETENEKL